MEEERWTTPIAIVDSDVLALSFEMIGIRSYLIRSKAEILRFLRENEKDLPHIIFMNERVYEKAEPYRREVLRRGLSHPVFAVVPDPEGRRGVRLGDLKDLLRRALGSEEIVL